MAVPVVVGSLGRIPVGALTDRFGGRVMFPLVSLATIVPVLYLGLFGQRLAGRRCWSAGSSSASAARPSRSACRSSTPGSRRSGGGWRSGSSASGMGGTAISALTTVKLVDGGQFGDAVPGHRVRCWRSTRWWPACCCGTRPGRTVPTEPFVRAAGRDRAAAGDLAGPHPVRRRLRRLRGVLGLPARPTCGPRYGLTQADAANRMAGFVLLAVLMRPVGGWLSDRFGPVPVLAVELRRGRGRRRRAGVHARR